MDAVEDIFRLIVDRVQEQAELIGNMTVRLEADTATKTILRHEVQKLVAEIEALKAEKGKTNADA